MELTLASINSLSDALSVSRTPSLFSLSPTLKTGDARSWQIEHETQARDERRRRGGGRWRRRSYGCHPGCRRRDRRQRRRWIGPRRSVNTYHVAAIDFIHHELCACILCVGQCLKYIMFKLYIYIYTFVGDGEDERELDKMLNSVALDAPGAACTETMEAKEYLIRECALH